MGRKDNRFCFRYYARMGTRSFRLSLFLAAAITASVFTAAGAQDLTMSAASSLTDVLLQLQNQAQRFVGVQIYLNFGGSANLRRQIEQGVPADLFFPAAGEDMDKLQKEGLIAAGSRSDILRNSLVVIADPSTKAAAAADLRGLFASAKAVAVGNPDTVPSGRYAVEAMKKYGLYDLAKPKRALGGTVREVLQLVQGGSAPLGVTFLTDVLSAQPPGSVVRIFQFPAETFSSPIVYPVAVTASSKNKLLAAKLIQFFRSDAARGVFVKAGFEAP